MGDAVLHDDPAARRIRSTAISGSRSTTKIAGPGVSISSGAGADQSRSRHEGGAGIHGKVDAAFRPLANKDNDYLMDRAAQKAGKTYQRRRGHRHAGCVVAGKHGTGRRSHQENLVSTDNGIVMARHAAARRRGAPDKGVAPPGTDIRRIRRSARARSCCRRMWRSRTAPRKRSRRPSPAWRRPRCSGTTKSRGRR